MSDSPGKEPLGLSIPENLTQVLQLIRPRFPHDLHDYALEGICKAADGLHVVSVVKTGGGKTTYFTGFMVLLQELNKLPNTHVLKKSLARRIPKNPVTIIVYPTKGLEEEMESTFNALGIPSLAINEDTLAAAHRRKENLWLTAARTDTTCIILSPEQLNSKHFQDLDDDSFYRRIVCLGVDEIHLILSWGLPQFRASFQDIGNTLSRLPTQTTLIGVTATLAAGNEAVKLVDILGLKPGSFFFNRRSNRRDELQYIFRVLRHGLQGWEFLDLKWVIEGTRKTIIYCGTVSVGFRLLLYFRDVLTQYGTPYSKLDERVRFSCAIYTPSYNTKSRNMEISICRR